MRAVVDVATKSCVSVWLAPIDAFPETYEHPSDHEVTNPQAKPAETAEPRVRIPKVDDFEDFELEQMGFGRP